MISVKLIRQIEDHWESIAARALRRIRSCADLPQLKAMPESDLHIISQRTLQNLSHWLHNNPDKEIAARYEELGRQRFKDGMMLCEAVRGLQLVKDSTLDYINDESFTSTSMEMLAEEELELQLGRFFDLLVFHLVRGYEGEMRRAMPSTAKSAAGVGR
jgi:hypothetical protein